MIKRPPKISRFAFSFVFITLFLLFSFLVTALAYGKVQLPHFPQVQTRTRHLVQNIPLTPKTPRFILEKSVLAHQKAKTNTFKIKATANNSALSEYIDRDNLEINTKGSADYSNPRKIRFTAKITSPEGYEVTIKKTSNIPALQINKIPPQTSELLNIPSEQLDLIIGQWIKIRGLQTTPADKSNQSLQAVTETLFNNLQHLEIFQNTKVEKVKEDEYKTYKLSFNPSDELIENVQKEIHQTNPDNDLPSEDSTANGVFQLTTNLKNVEMQIFIDRKSYLVRKIILSGDIIFNQNNSVDNSIQTNQQNNSKNTKTNISLTATFDNFGENVIIYPPTNPINLEELLVQLIRMYPNEIKNYLQEIEEPGI